MKVKAKASFSGKIAMFKGQEADVEPSLAREYVACGYLEEVEDGKQVEENESKPNNRRRNAKADKGI